MAWEGCGKCKQHCRILIRRHNVILVQLKRLEWTELVIFSHEWLLGGRLFLCRFSRNLQLFLRCLVKIIGKRLVLTYRLTNVYNFVSFADWPGADMGVRLADCISCSQQQDVPRPLQSAVPRRFFTRFLGVMFPICPFSQYCSLDAQK